MKKNLRNSFFTASVVMLMAAGTSASAQTKCLREITSETGMEYYYYGYNADNKLDSVWLEYPENDIRFYRLYKYDENGNQTCEENYTDMYQDMFDGMTGFFVTGRNDYGYDENNRLVSKITYELDFDSYDYILICVGAYKYFYDDEGKITKEVLYYDESMTYETECTSYYYDADNRLIRKDLKVSYYDEDEIETSTAYVYDEQGRLLNVKISYNDGTGALVEYETISYTYDAEGNLVKRSDVTLDYADPVLEYQVTYRDDLKASDVVFPMNYEDDTDFYTMSANAVEKTDIYAQIQYDDGEEYGRYDTQFWVYDDLEGGTTGVEKVTDKKPFSIIVNDGKLMLKGIDGAAGVRIYDVNGRPVYSGMARSEINISNLPKGVYVASSNGVVKKFSVK